MSWTVDFHESFRAEFSALDSDVRVELAACLILLREKGPRLGRPEVDTLERSKHRNMKELRLRVRRVQWRFAFAFDPERKALVLCGGSKSGVSQTLFYKRMIELADRRLDDHLAKMESRHGRPGSCN